MLATRSHVQSPVCVHLQDHVLANEHKARQVHVSQKVIVANIRWHRID